MIVSDAALAPTSPPETGASRYSQPKSAIFGREAFGFERRDRAHVDDGFSGERPYVTPCSPKSTAATSGVSGNIRITISLRFGDIFGELHSVAPCRAIRAQAQTDYRGRAVSGVFGDGRHRAAMMPSPMKPTS